jgi:two-component system response regulator HydG
MAAVDAGIFEAWLTSTDDGAVAIDADGRVVLHNPAASRVTGLAPADALRRPWREVLRLDPSVAELIWSVRLAGRPARVLAEVLCAQGNLRTADTLAHPWTDVAGRTGVLVTMHDLTVLCRRRTGPGGRPGYGGMVGADRAMEAIFDLIEAVAGSDAPVVVEGEPGTGKELVAQQIHARSQRAERPLMAVDCAALAGSALEQELFGREGAHGAAGIGRVELAHTGTLFLDRIEEASAAVQTRLLRLLETGLLERAGETTPRRADVRIVAASARPLAAEARTGRFREDLRQRLQVVRIALPPLRERRGDIPLLADYFLAKLGPPGAALTPAALAVLQACDWPGNVRQLENLVRQIVAGPRDRANPAIGPELLPEELLTGGGDAPRGRPPRPSDDRRALLLRALSSHGGNRTAAARALGIGRATFYRWWREAGLGP